MKIKSVRIKNFRSFEDETVSLGEHTCFVGANGAGKSTVLSALNIFFQDLSCATDVTNLTKEDFHNGNTRSPVEITVTFHDLSDSAKETLSHYVRQNELIVTATAQYNESTNRAPVFQYGERMVLKQFVPYFDEEKNGALVAELRTTFAKITKGLQDFPDLGKSPTKVAMTASLRQYEEQKSAQCDPIRSTDQFYGTSKGKGKLEPFIQWIYIPAVKDASLEGEEAGNTALGKLLQRTVRQKINFDEALFALQQKTRLEYDALLEAEQDKLKELSTGLAERLAKFAHPNAGLSVEWLQGSEKAVRIDEPRATVKATEGPFKGSLVRFGHGLQRSFLLVILQELASIERSAAEENQSEYPTLVLGVEEPELYQHPPQARHLSSELRDLTETGSQVLITTHSAYFVSGESFDEIRLVRKNASGKSSIKQTDFSKYAKRIATATGKIPEKSPVARARLMAALRPEPSELYFCQRLILVEGLEDRAYVSAALVLEGMWNDVRRAGLHVLSCDRKSNILQLLTIAQELEIPCFVIFDADGDEENADRRAQHEHDNKALITALGISCSPFPDEDTIGENFAIWPKQIEASVRAGFELAEWTELCNKAKKQIDPNASLKKNPVFIGETMSLAWTANKKPAALTSLSKSILNFTR